MLVLQDLFHLVDSLEPLFSDLLREYVLVLGTLEVLSAVLELEVGGDLGVVGGVAEEIESAHFVEGVFGYCEPDLFHQIVVDDA